ncbi:MAG TPA: argininosuccinate lyase [Anaerolineae bacterium]|jgi:argininosuccinate lyase|nr:argininosuccinate lyase [Anaerolineae bacterium]
MKAWGGRFSARPDAEAAAFGRSIEIDVELAMEDIAGSLAHVESLAGAGLLSPAEVEAISAGLHAIEADVRDGSIEWDPAHEDIHMNVEMALAERIGPLAGKLHTGRSRNDQVATDLRLYLRRRVSDVLAAIIGLEAALVGLGLAHRDAVMPGHTHVQPAQPVLFAHHLLAYVEMLERDGGRFADALRRADLSPLGSGALAGAGFRLDREATAEALGFRGVTRNSIDAVGDRDPVVETISAAALTMTHLSRLAEEIVWWSNPQFGFLRPADGWSTGSSMMPNKRNPDPAELVRGRSGRVIGHLVTALTMLKGLPGGYQRDLQEDKPALIDALAVTESSLRVMAGMVASLRVDEARMLVAATAGYTTATAVADALVELGVPFREGHHIVGALVARAERAGIELTELPDSDIATVLAASTDPAARAVASEAGVAAALRAAARLENALARPDVIGGTAPARVHAELAANAARLGIAH